MRENRTAGKVQQRRSRIEVEELLDAFESGGVRRGEFCRKHGIAVGTLDFWRKRRRQERGGFVGRRQRAGKAAVRAGIESEGRLVAVEIAGTATSGRLAVVLSRGRRVEVPEGFDAATLERLLAVLELQ